MADKVLRFSTVGPDRYADGSFVLDGECYALVWSPAGKAFSGFNADGTAVSSQDRVVLAAPLALGGRCRDAIFQVPAGEYAELAGGDWVVCLVDTRTAAGVPAGVRDGKPLRVNRWGAVRGAVKVEPAGASGLVAASLRSSVSRQKLAVASSGAAEEGVCADARSAIPDSVLRNPPQITDIDVSGGKVRLTVENTVPCLTYTISSGKTPDALSEDYAADIVDGNDNSTIEIKTPETVSRRFFRVVRAE